MPDPEQSKVLTRRPVRWLRCLSATCGFPWRHLEGAVTAERGALLALEAAGVLQGAAY